MFISNEQMEKANEELDKVVPFKRPTLAYSGGGSGSSDWLSLLDEGWQFLARPRDTDFARLGIPRSRLILFEIVYRAPGHPVVLLITGGQEWWVVSTDFSQEWEMILARNNGADNTSDSGGDVLIE